MSPTRPEDAAPVTRAMLDCMVRPPVVLNGRPLYGQRWALYLDGERLDRNGD